MTKSTNNTPAYDHTGYCSVTSETNRAMLKAYIATLTLEELNTVLDESEDAELTDPEGDKAEHYLITAIFCEARINTFK